jgi:hypothetical protein
MGRGKKGKNRAKKGRREKDPKQKKNPRDGHYRNLTKKRGRDISIKKEGGAAKFKTRRRCPLPPSFFLTSIPPSLSIKS